MAVTHNLHLQQERHRWTVPLALVTSAALVALWFPFSALLHQQRVIDSTAAQIQAVQREDRALTSRAKSGDSAAAATRLARQQYQLVAPGQSLIQVLPGRASKAAAPGQGDPGLQPLVSPGATAPTPGAPHHPNAFLARLWRTLEFWR